MRHWLRRHGHGMVLRRWHRLLRIIVMPRLMHRVHLLLLLIRVPVWRILLRILRHHGGHVLGIVGWIARLPHVWWHGSI